MGGLFPYIFTRRRHISFTLTLALPLSIRLAANMVAGHLLLTLLGSQGPTLRIFNLILLIGGLFILLLLEVAVACIQSYVFTILSSLYLNELLRNEFNKKMIR